MMPKAYYPQRYIDVVASPPHKGNPSYRVSVGTEMWAGGDPQHVYKIQMAYNGVVSGRKAPSYPEGTDDLERVYEAMLLVKKGGGKSARGMIEAVGSEPGIPLKAGNDILKAKFD
jgi:hypothetical protein